MKKDIQISIVYHSGTGHTKKLAEAVFEGLNSVSGITAKIFSIEGKDIKEGRWSNPDIMQQLDQSCGIIFGCPTYMGGVSAQMKAFLDASSEKFFSRSWKDKIAAGFTVSGGASGDKLNTLISLFITAMQNGMIWVGQEIIPYNDKGFNRLSFFVGAAGQALMESPDIAPNEEDKKTAFLLGTRVATITKRFHGIE